MIFNSYSFMFFSPIILFVYFVVPKKYRYIWLLIASYYFYMSWNIKYVIFLMVSTCLTFFSGLVLNKVTSEDKKNKRKFILILCLFLNLGILCYFKYFDFFANNINYFLSKLSISLITNPFDIMMPLGISFYTFQSLSYIIDVYRGNSEVRKNILKYALFVSFFPTICAGPIERANNLLFQIEHIHKVNLIDFDRIKKGCLQMVWGFFLKMVIADRIAVLVSEVHDNYHMYGSTVLILAALLYGVQIYCDFSSYSTIAIGASHIMGFKLKDNFNVPYLSSSVAEFWRRWHISLSSWFKDYIYIPLGGNRCSKSRKYLNVMITFLVSGLWHGASWNFILWGGMHGAFQIVGSELTPVKEKFN